MAQTQVLRSKVIEDVLCGLQSLEMAAELSDKEKDEVARVRLLFSTVKEYPALYNVTLIL